MIVAHSVAPLTTKPEQPQPRASDLELRTGLAANLDGCFEQLVVCYQNQLYAFALRISGNSLDAEEIAQDAFVRAYHALAGYPAEQIQALALRSWLYQIALNVFRNRIRGHKVQLVSFDELSVADRADPSDDKRTQPAFVFEHAERQRELEAILATLPERYRIPLVLRHVEGFRYEELAALLNQPLGTVKSNVHRGVHMLRKMITAQDEKVQ